MNAAIYARVSTLDQGRRISSRSCGNMLRPEAGRRLNLAISESPN